MMEQQLQIIRAVDAAAAQFDGRSLLTLIRYLRASLPEDQQAYLRENWQQFASVSPLAAKVGQQLENIHRVVTSV